MSKKWLIIVILLTLTRLNTSVAAENATAEKMTEEAQKLVKKLEGNRFQLGDIVIDKNNNSIRFPAKVNMSEGVLEVLLSAPHGKLHEALLVTEVDAIHLNLALIMIGCKAGEMKVKEQGQDVIPEGTLLKVEIAYKEDKEAKEKIIRAEDWVFDDKQKKAMAQTNWVYTGSFVSDGEYMAQLTGTYIVTFHDPYTIIDIALKEGADDTVFWVNKDAVKKKGFPVEIIITALEKDDEEKTGEEKTDEDKAEENKADEDNTDKEKTDENKPE